MRMTKTVKMYGDDNKEFIANVDDVEKLIKAKGWRLKKERKQKKEKPVDDEKATRTLRKKNE